MQGIKVTITITVLQNCEKTGMHTKTFMVTLALPLLSQFIQQLVMPPPFYSVSLWIVYIVTTRQMKNFHYARE